MDCKGKHPLDFLKQLCNAPLFVAVNQHFGVRHVPKPTPCPREFGLEFGEVVNLPVVHDRYVLHRVVLWLSTFVVVDNGEPLHPERPAFLSESPYRRAPFFHRVERFPRRRRIGIKPLEEKTCNARCS